MATPQKITKAGKTLYRVQIIRKTKGIHIDEYRQTKKQAEALIRQVETAIENGQPIGQNVRGRETFAAGLEIYLEQPLLTPKGKPMKDSAAKDRTNRLKWLSKNCFSDILLKHLSLEVVDEKLSQQATERKWSSASRYRYETALSRFLEYAKRQNWVAHNVMTGADRLNDSGKRNRIYTEDEWTTLLDAADQRTDMLSIFLRLAWDTGSRKSELLNLRWVDVEPATQKGLGARLELIDTKNGETRAVFTNERTGKLLDAHEQEFRRSGSELVFPSRTNKGRYNVNAPFTEARTKAKLDAPDKRYGEVLGIHAIRHTWATRLGDKGVSLAQLMSAAGWKTPAMAERYMKRKESQAAEAALMLATT